MKALDRPETLEFSDEKLPIYNGRRHFQELLTAAQEGRVADRATLERNLQLLQSYVPEEIRLDPEVAALIGQCRRAINKLKGPKR